MILQVGTFDPGARPDETARLKQVGRPDPAASRQPTQADRQTPERFCRREQRHRLAAGHLDINLQMILKIAPHPGLFMAQRQTGIAQHLARPNPRQLQQLR